MSAGAGSPDSAKSISLEFKVFVDAVLRDFRDSDIDEVQLPATLSVPQRQFTERIARKMGLLTKCTGYGDGTRLNIMRDKAVAGPLTSAVHRLHLSHESQEVLQGFEKESPGGPEDTPRLDPGRVRDTVVDRAGLGYFTEPPDFKKAAVPAESPLYNSKLVVRKKLPIWGVYKDVIDGLLENRVLVVCGDTGSGKSTQVPQMILSHPVLGRNARVVVTQPRRLSAVSLAERVAFERCETVGGTVGYFIRLDAHISPATRLLFCTTGILMRHLNVDPQLSGVNYIVLDEVHEREADLVLKPLLSTRSDLKIVIMSATLEADTFSQYFIEAGHSVGYVQADGRMFPVQTFHLEDVLELIDFPSPTGYSRSLMSRRGLQCGLCGQHTFKDAFRLEAHTVFCARKPTAALTMPVDTPIPAPTWFSSTTSRSALDEERAMRSPSSTAAGGPGVPTSLRKVSIHPDDVPTASASSASPALVEHYEASLTDEDAIDTRLLIHVLEHICMQLPSLVELNPSLTPSIAVDGAVLVFLPGWDEIVTVELELKKHAVLSAPIFHVFTLHSSVPTEEQNAVFDPLPEGHRKIILATNIAETSITINDVVFVVDCGRVKELYFDAHTELSSLTSCWIPKASAKQRTGRAGRVQPGVCYRLYTKQRFEYMRQFKLPEILWTPLEDLALQVKMMELASSMSTKHSALVLAPPTAVAASSSLLTPIQLATHNFTSGLNSMRSLFQSLGLITPLISPVDTASPHRSFDFEPERLPVPCVVERFFAKALEPPRLVSVKRSVRKLQDIGALRRNEEASVTRIGQALAGFPMSAPLGNLLVYGILLGCLDPMLTLATTIGQKPPFVIPKTQEDRVKARDAKLALSRGTLSDHLATVAAFNGFIHRHDKDDQFEYCSRMFLSASVLETIEGQRAQVMGALLRRGCIPGGNISHANRNSNRPHIVLAAVAAGLYPNIGCKTKEFVAEKQLINSLHGHKLEVHFGSVNGRGSHATGSVEGKQWFAYDDMAITGKQSVKSARNCSVVSMFSLLLCCDVGIDQLESAGTGPRIAIIPPMASASSVRLLRNRLLRAVELIVHPRDRLEAGTWSLPPECGDAVETFCRILTLECGLTPGHSGCGPTTVAGHFFGSSRAPVGPPSMLTPVQILSGAKATERRQHTGPPSAHLPTAPISTSTTGGSGVSSPSRAGLSGSREHASSAIAVSLTASPKRPAPTPPRSQSTASVVTCPFAKGPAGCTVRSAGKRCPFCEMVSSQHQ